MIDVRQAVQAAVNYVDLFPGLMPPATQMRLEETEYGENSNQWYITLSFTEHALTGARSYKIFEVDAETGEVVRMKNRHWSQAL